MFHLDRVVAEGLCTGCGLCAGISDQIDMHVANSGYERPVASDQPLPTALQTVLADACPGVHVRGLDTDTIAAAPHHDAVWGPYERLVKAHASDPEVRHRASTGGVLTALAQYLLASGRAAFILHVRAGGRDPSFGQMHLSTDPKQVLDGAGSRYGPAAPLERIDQVLDRGQPFAFVGKPCDISALRALGDHDARVGELVVAYLTMVCGGYGPPQSTHAFFERLGTHRDQVAQVRYRGYGCPGATRVQTHEGEVFEASYEDFWGTDSSMWQLPWRCKICPDGIGDGADVAAADDWPGATPDREAAQSDPGTNAVIVRTQVGAALMQAAEAAGFLTLGAEVTPAYMTSIQPHQMRKKFSALSRWRGLTEVGRLQPRSTNLRLEDLTAQLSREQAAEQIDGVKVRVAAGRAVD